MDPLSLSVSIITIVTLAGQLVTLGKNYTSSVAGCPKEIKDLLAELTSLGQVLTALGDVIDPAKATSKTPIMLAGILTAPVNECQKQLNEMFDFLNNYQNQKSKMRKAIKRMTWPLKEADTKAWITKIEGHKSTFTLALSADGMAITRSISIDVVVLKQEQENARKQQQLQYIVERLREIRQWLSSADPRMNYKAARALQQAGTGNWVVEGNQFKDWLREDNSFLWINGIAGSGKTILSSIIIDKILAKAQAEDITLVYFYCDSKDPAKNNAVNLYGSLIAQLLEQGADIPDEVNHLYDSFHKKQPTLVKLKDVFSDVAQRFTKVVVIIDGLDECIDCVEVANGLLELRNDPTNDNTSVLVTSTNEFSIRTAFSSVPSLVMKADKIAVDIELYVKSEIDRRPKLRRLKPEIKAEIIKTLVNKSNGIFKDVKRCLEHIALLRNDKAIRQALNSFPPSLHERYESILTKIPEEDKDLAIRVLEWLVCSIRPMTIDEIAEAVSIELGNLTLDPGNKLNDPEDILDICKDLVGLDKSTRILELAHPSVKDYLTSARIATGPASAYQIDQKTIHIELAKLCLTYVCFDDFALGPCDTNDKLKSRFKEHPLLEYAAHNWQKHARYDEKNEDDELVSMVEEFLNPLSSASIFLSWSQAYHTESSELSCDHNAFNNCKLLMSSGTVDFRVSLYTEFSRQPNCGCQQENLTK